MRREAEAEHPPKLSSPQRVGYGSVVDIEFGDGPPVLAAPQFLAGEQFTRPREELTEKVLPDAVYLEQPIPSIQNVCVPQSIENELESKSKAQPVLDVAARTKLSVLPLTTHVSLALLQIGQAYCCAAPEPPEGVLPPSLSTTPPQALAPASDNPRSPNPKIRRTTHQAYHRSGDARRRGLARALQLHRLSGTRRPGEQGGSEHTLRCARSRWTMRERPVVESMSACVRIDRAQIESTRSRRRSRIALPGAIHSAELAFSLGSSDRLRVARKT